MASPTLPARSISVLLLVLCIFEVFATGAKFKVSRIARCNTLVNQRHSPTRTALMMNQATEGASTSNSQTFAQFFAASLAATKKDAVESIRSIAEELHIESENKEEIAAVVKTEEKIAALTETEVIAADAVKNLATNDVDMNIETSVSDGDHSEKKSTEERTESNGESANGSVESTTTVAKKSKSTWTTHEDDTLRKYVAENSGKGTKGGIRWQEVIEVLPNRGADACKRRWTALHKDEGVKVGNGTDDNHAKATAAMATATASKAKTNNAEEKVVAPKKPATATADKASPAVSKPKATTKKAENSKSNGDASSSAPNAANGSTKAGGKVEGGADAAAAVASKKTKLVDRVKKATKSE